MGTVAEFQPELVAKLFGGVDLGGRRIIKKPRHGCRQHGRPPAQQLLLSALTARYPDS
eukprot:COSAG06_NODE_37408_length_435_cov_1.196429_1_plen_58_part_01